MNETENILGMQDLLERSLEEIKKRFLPFFILAACSPLAGWFIQGLFLGFDPLQQNQQPVVWQSLLSSVLIGLVSAWFTIALVLFICKHTQTISDSLKLALYRLPRLLIGMFLYGLCIAAGMICAFAVGFVLFYVLQEFAWAAALLIILWTLFFIIVFFAIAVYWIFVPYCLILTELPLTACFTQSYRLVRGHFWHTVGLLVLLALIGMLVALTGVLAVGALGAVCWALLPASRYIIFILWTVPAALLTLVYQVPVLALYLDLSTNVETEK